MFLLKCTPLSRAKVLAALGPDAVAEVDAIPPSDPLPGSDALREFRADVNVPVDGRLVAIRYGTDPEVANIDHYIIE